MKKDRSGRQPYIGNWIAFLPKPILSTGLIIVLLSLGIFSAHAQLPNDFQRVDLLTNLTNATTFKFAPDGRVFIVDRYGELLIYDPVSQTSFSAGTIEVFHELEDGLLGLAFDPNFLTNNFIYLHYSPLATSVNRVSRFTLNGNSLVMNSEVVVLQWPTQRISCCHSGGDMDFDSQGNLYIATGDNTDHSNYATLNESNINKSSENTSSDTKDLRGKILRITPLADGSYTIPPGNLFNDPLVGRPEVYVMGARNPYRIFIDRENSDWLFWGEVGPDANTPSSFNEPEGLDEINLTKTAGNYGWPYFSGQNRPYRIHYAQTPYFNDPASPKNISKWNTGTEDLPPAQPSLLQFLHKCYLAGPRYYHDPGISDSKRLPVEFNNKFFYYDFNSSWIWVATLDSQGNVQGTPERLAPSVFPTAATGFIDMKIGPDGHLYILEYGTGCCPGNTGTGKLVRVDYTGIVSNSSPIASISATPNNGDVPLTVQFSAAGSSDPDGDILTYEWDFENDGIVDATGVTTSHTYTNIQNYTALLRVNDGNGGVVTKTTMIYAGNTISEFTFNSPPDGGLINWNDDINFNVSVNDAEDGSTQNGGIDCNDVNLVPSIGHLNHFHDDLGLTGCPQLINLDPGDHDIHGEMDIFYVLGVNYKDNGGLTSFDQIQLHPKRKEAEFYSTSNNVVKIGNSDIAGGGNEAIRVNNNSNISLAGRNLQNISSVKYRVASQVSGGTIELRVGSASGALINTAAIPNTGGTNNWTDVVANFTAPSGKNDLYFVFRNASVQQNIFDLNYIEFLGAGVSIDNSPPEIMEVEVISTTQLKVNFSEYITEGSAENVNNYILNNGASVQTAVLQTDLRSVLLNTTVLNSGTAYQLNISNVENLAGIPMLPASFDLNIFQPIRINPGGPQIMIGGNTFSPDQYSAGGSTFSNSVAIANTSDDVLYQTERYGSNFSYNIPVPQDGAYDFKLHFAEIYFGVGNNPGGAGSRVFNVSIEGNQLISNLDIYAEAGPATALIKEFSDIAVNDGVATIQFNSVIENAKISGIEVLARGSASDNEPSITISSPQEGSTVNSPVQVSFSLSNWNLAPGDNHIKYYVDGNLRGSHYNTNPILIGQLTPGAHNFKLELFYADQSSSGVSDQVNIVVNDPSGCNSGIFPDQWQPHIIGPAQAYRSVYILPQFDLDNDGLKDIVSGGWWYKNPGSIAGNWTKNTIGTNFNNVAYVHDFDGDGDPDLLGTKGAYESSALIWARNDGNGNFTIHDNLPVGATTYSEPFLAGIAGGIYQQGGPFQLALNWNGAETGTSQVQMLTVPSDPENGTWTLVNIHPTSLGEALSNGDIDGDGDLDLFQGSNWLRNDGGTWTLFSTGITFPTTMDRNMLADFDQDGDLDAVVTQIGSNREIAWFEAPADPTQPWIKHTIDPDIDGGLSLDVKDIDFDGDLDIVVGEWRGVYQLIGFANDLCNTGGWIKKTIDSGGGNLDHHDGAQIVDLDKDGDFDIVSIGWNNITPRIFENQSNIQASDPLANAGPDRSITLPTNSLTLNGTGSDPDGGNVSFAWTEVSHPGTPANLTNANTANLTASGLVEGTYVFRLTVSDDESATALDEVSVTVNPEPAGGQDEHWLEAECATVGSNWSVITDAQASDGEYLLAPSGNNYSTPPTSPASMVSFQVNATAGTYKVIARVKAPTGEDDSFFIRVNGGSWLRWNMIPGGDFFSWHQVHNEEQRTNFVTYELVDGINTIDFGHREDGVGLDKVYITKTGSVPSGLGSPASNCGPPPASDPLANAGPDRSITLPTNSLTLNGTGSDPDGGNVSFAWTAISHPGTPATLTNANTANLTASGLVEGTYVFRLTVTDDESATAFDEVSVTVNPEPAGSDPLVNAGSDRSITLPTNSLTLNGSGSDPDGGNVSFAWTEVSHPGTPANLTNANTANLTASGLVEGTYVFRLTVSDDESATALDEVSVTVNPEPAGGQDEHWLEAECATVGSNWSVITDAQASDGEYLLAPSGNNYSTPPTSPASMVSFQVNATAGTYKVIARVKAPTGEDDSFFIRVNGGSWLRWNMIPGGDFFSWHQVHNEEQRTNFVTYELVDGINTIDFGHREDGVGLDKVYITKTGSVPSGLGSPASNCGPPPASDPLANAGPDRSITLPTNSLTLNGTGSDPDGGNVSFAWTAISHPGTPATLTNANTANLTASGLVEGTYVFRLTVTDDESATAFDEVSVTVNPEPAGSDPLVNAGSDRSITLPTNSLTLNGSGSDPDGGNVSFAWTEVSHPGTPANLTNANTANLTASGLVEGTYVFRLTVSDDESATALDEVSVTVNPEPAGGQDEHWLEAECATVGSNWSVITDAQASDGEYLLAPSGNNYSTPPTSPASMVSFQVNATAGTYKVIARVKAPTGEDDSFFIRVNGGSWLRWNMIPGGDFFSWHQVHNEEQRTNFVTYELVDGINTIDFGHREDGVGLDKVYITKTGSVPSGPGNPASNCGAPTPQPPVANAGQDRSITLPTNSLSLTGSGSDPDGGAVSYAWAEVSNPGNPATLNNVNTATLTASNLSEGTYVFRLTVTDDESDTAFDEVSVMVNPEPAGGQDEHWLEAECATVGSLWTETNDGSASGGTYLLAPNGTNYNTPPTSPASIVSFQVNATAGTYKVIARVKAPTGEDDSFFIRVNGGSWVRWNLIPGGNFFSWHQVYYEEQRTNLVTYDLVDGINTIEFGHREDGVGLDKVYITKTGSVPSGLGNAATNCNNASKIAQPDPLIISMSKDIYKVELYPNPTAEISKVVLDRDIPSLDQILIFDATGRLVRTQKVSRVTITGIQQHEVNVDGLEEGTYHLQFLTADGHSFYKQLVVKK